MAKIAMVFSFFEKKEHAILRLSSCIDLKFRSILMLKKRVIAR